MKKILLISDTHGYIDKKILKYCQLADEVWHAGDVGDIKIIDQIKKLKPLRGVYGNIDNNEIRKELTKDCIFICEKMKVWIKTCVDESGLGLNECCTITSSS